MSEKSHETFAKTLQIKCREMVATKFAQDFAAPSRTNFFNKSYKDAQQAS